MIQYLVFFKRHRGAPEGSRRQISATSEGEALAIGLATGFTPYMIAHEEFQGAGKAIEHRNVERGELRQIRKKYMEEISKLQICKLCSYEAKSLSDLELHRIFDHLL